MVGVQQGTLLQCIIMFKVPIAVYIVYTKFMLLNVDSWLLWIFCPGSIYKKGIRIIWPIAYYGHFCLVPTLRHSAAFTVLTYFILHTLFSMFFFYFNTFTIVSTFRVNS